MVRVTGLGATRGAGQSPLEGEDEGAQRVEAPNEQIPEEGGHERVQEWENGMAG